MSCSSQPFIISLLDASNMVNAHKFVQHADNFVIVENNNCANTNQRNCYPTSNYMLTLTFKALYGNFSNDHPTFSAICRKLPRIVNKIPFGPGRFRLQSGERTLSRCHNSSSSELDSLSPDTHTPAVIWRCVDGLDGVYCFISTPISEAEAIATKNSVQERLTAEAKDIFGDLTVKTSIILSACVSMEANLIVNDIASSDNSKIVFRD